MAVHRTLKASQKAISTGAAGKEDVSPRKKRRTISVSTLFDQKQDLRRKAVKDAQDVLAPKSAGVLKQYGSSRSSKRSEQHPLYRKFLGATKDYRDGIAGATGEQLDPVYNELIERVDSLAVSGSTGQGKNVETEAQMNALAQEHARLANPLGEDKIEIQRTKADGSTVAQERKLSETMKAFERVLDQKRGDIEQLLRELSDVDVEIADVKQDILAVEQKEAKKLKRELDARVAVLMKQAEATKEATLAEVNKARKDEESAKKAQSRKFEDFMKTI